MLVDKADIVLLYQSKKPVCFINSLVSDGVAARSYVGVYEGFM